MENNPVSCKLKIPKDLDGKTPVFFVDFCSDTVNLHYSSKLKFSCYQHAGDSGVKRVLLANNGYLNYQSRSDENKDDRNKFNYFIGVRNKTSKKMKVCNAIPFHLMPLKNASNQESLASSTKNFREKIDDLTMNFGSKDMKRSMVARQKNTVDSATLDIVQDVSLEDSVDNVNSSLSFSSTPSNTDYLPSINHEAQTVDQVYNIDSIISPEEDEFLDKSAEELLNEFPSHERMLDTFCEYVQDHFKGNNVSRTKAKYLLYYNYLVAFSKLLLNDIRKKDPAPKIPEPVKGCLLDHFTVVSGTNSGKVSRSFPSKMKDKILAYILVLALIIDDYYVNLAQIQMGTKYSVKKVTNVAEALGCHIRRQKIDNCVVQFAELKLPLFVKKLKKY